MRNVFDHLGRTIGVSALGPCGLTVAEDVIAPDARRADLRHEPDPARADERVRLGLLGRMASIPCLIELYSGGMFRMGIVVASELPRDRSTRLVRFMAAGPLLAGAIAELAALHPGARERTVAEQILVELQEALGKKPGPTLEEQEFIVSMQSTWEEARRMGEARGEARALLAALRVRGIPVPDAARERILAEHDTERLERRVERSIVAISLAEVLDGPS